MIHFKRVVSALVLLVAVLPLSATEQITPMRYVRDMVCEKGEVEVNEDLCIEGYVVSKPNGHNNDLNVQVAVRPCRQRLSVCVAGLRRRRTRD